MRVQFRLHFLNKEHFVDEAFKFPATFIQDGKLLVKILVILIVGVTQVFFDSFVLMFIKALEKVSQV